MKCLTLLHEEIPNLNHLQKLNIDSNELLISPCFREVANYNCSFIFRLLFIASGRVVSSIETYIFLAVPSKKSKLFPSLFWG